MSVHGLSLDTGALIAIERGDQRMQALVEEAIARDLPVHAVAGVVAQCWRGGPRRARLARVLATDGVTVHPLDELTAHAVGELCGSSGHADVVDVHVVLHARLHHHAIATADEEDMRTVDPSVPLVLV